MVHVPSLSVTCASFWLPYSRVGKVINQLVLSSYPASLSIFLFCSPRTLSRTASTVYTTFPWFFFSVATHQWRSYNPQCSSHLWLSLLWEIALWTQGDTDLQKKAVDDTLLLVSLQGIPLGRISAALTFNRNELHAVKSVRCEKGVNLLLRLQIHISFIFLTSLGCAQKARWVLRIPWLPWLVSDPYIICKREPTSYANKCRVPAETIRNKLQGVH